MPTKSASVKTHVFCPAVARPISQYLSQSYKSSLPNSLNYFILYWIESVQLENLLRIGVRKEEGAWSDLLTCSDSKRFKDDKMKRNENNGWFGVDVLTCGFREECDWSRNEFRITSTLGEGRKTRPVRKICTARTVLDLLLYFFTKTSYNLFNKKR